MRNVLKTFFDSLSPRLDTRPAATHIDDYLDHLCAPLVGKMTYDQRLAVREEVRAHLLVLAAAHEELGGSPGEALQAAMDSLGCEETRTFAGQGIRHAFHSQRTASLVSAACRHRRRCRLHRVRHHGFYASARASDPLYRSASTAWWVRDGLDTGRAAFETTGLAPPGGRSHGSMLHRADDGA